MSSTSSLPLAKRMEELRLEANAHFKEGRLDVAGSLYKKALDAFDEAADASSASKLLAFDAELIGEYTKSAGNLCTCLHKLKQLDECINSAKRAISVNPFLAKCHGFLGMCLMEKESRSAVVTANSADHLEIVAWRESAIMHMCRSMLILSAMVDQLRPSLTALVLDTAASMAAYAATSSAPSEQDANHTVGVEIREAGPHMGNGVFVVEGTYIPRGTQICSLLHPFSAAPYAETMGQGLCVACGVANQRIGDPRSGVGCLHCNAVWYCSDRCSLVHSYQHSELECNAFQKLKVMVASIEERQLDVPDDFEDLAAHVIVTRSALLSRRKGCERFNTLSHHSNEVSQGLLPIPSLLKDLFPDESIEWLTQLLGAIRSNSMEVCDATGLGVGQALHLDGVESFFNHSCQPNCAIDHTTQTIRTIRTVAPNEALTISYIPQLYWPTKLRRTGLADRFYFTCHCQRCSHSDTDSMERVLLQVLPQAKPDATGYFHEIVQMLCAGIRSRPIQDVDDSVIDELLKTQRDVAKHLHETHYLNHDIQNTLTFVYSVLNKPAEALKSSLRELLLWECIIPGALPVKLDKVRNASLCLSELPEGSAHCVEPLFTLLGQLKQLYGIS